MGQKTLDLIALCQSKGLRYVDSKGPTASPVWLCGEAPGEHEEHDLIPFTGYSGKEQEKMLREAGWNPAEICFTNPFKVRPPDNDLSRIEEKGIPRGTYLDQFIEELYEAKPSILICVGGTSVGILCPHTRGKKGTVPISKWQGSILTSPLLNWPHYIVPVYHPAYILRDWAERQVAVFCYARAFEEYSYFKKNGAFNPLPQRELILQPAFSDLLEYFNECEKAERISVDIETLRRRLVYTIALAVSPTRSCSLCLWRYGAAESIVIFRRLQHLLGTKKQIGQNYLGFDVNWLSTLGFRVRPDLVDDTLIRHNVLWPEFSHKLEFMTMQYTREPYYKDEGRNWNPKDGFDKFLRYNAKDAAVTYEVFDRQEEEFAERK